MRPEPIGIQPVKRSFGVITTKAKAKPRAKFPAGPGVTEEKVGGKATLRLAVNSFIGKGK